MKTPPLMQHSRIRDAHCWPVGRALDPGSRNRGRESGPHGLLNCHCPDVIGFKMRGHLIPQDFNTLSLKPSFNYHFYCILSVKFICNAKLDRT